MFSKFFLTAALSLAAFAAVAQEAPASVASAASAVTSETAATTASSTSTAPEVQSDKPTVASRVGGWLGGLARSVVDTPVSFARGVKQGFTRQEATNSTAPSSVNVAASATTETSASVTSTAALVAPPTIAAADAKTEVVGSRLLDLRSKLLQLALGRQAPAPVETRVIPPQAKAEVEEPTNQ